MNTNKNKSRTLINLIGLPSVLFIVYQGGILFQLFVCIVMFLAIKEFSELMEIKNYSVNTMFLYSFILIFIFYNSPSIIEPFEIKSIFQYPAFILIIYILILSVWEIFRSNKNPLENVSLSIFALIWIILCLNFLYCIRNFHIHGFAFTLCMLLSVWSCDSAAFFFGSKFGKKKILPNISPNKTWVGTISGFLFSIFSVLIFSYFIPELKLNCYDILVLGSIFGIVGQLGDFFESKIKRELGVKDSGTILQGHGGILDRFDSLFFVIPAFYFYLIFRFPIF